jgi:transcriptional regulator with XRE-family HTH domain
VFIRRPGDIGLVVKAARKARAMSQADLAKRLGVSRLWINEFEGGKPTARLDLVLSRVHFVLVGVAAWLDLSHVRRRTYSSPVANRYEVGRADARTLCRTGPDVG